MSIVVLQLPNVKRKTEIRPQKCRYCQGETFRRWGSVGKPVRDSRIRSAQVYRYRCCRWASCHLKAVVACMSCGNKSQRDGWGKLSRFRRSLSCGFCSCG